MKIYRTEQGIVIDQEGKFFIVKDEDWDKFINRKNLHEYVSAKIKTLAADELLKTPDNILAPIQHQEIWASGVTYLRSREARVEEARDAGAGDFYARVYEAERPELFFKATASRVVGNGGNVRIRRDSKWNVPEPELALVVNSRKELVGFTVGNDMSSRDIEGENILYLPQAKIYKHSCALGPCITMGATEEEARTWTIAIHIFREGKDVFSGKTSVDQIKRRFSELIDYLWRSQHFPNGAVLLTGTGIVPQDDFTLAPGDVVRINISGIGSIENTVVEV